MPCVIIEPGPEHVDVGESEDCLNHLESEGCPTFWKPQSGPLQDGRLISAQQARSCSSCCCPGTVVGLRIVDATRQTLLYGMVCRGSSRAGTPVGHGHGHGCSSNIIYCRQIKLKERDQSQSMDALGRPRIALCKKKCEIWRAPADEHLVVGWHIDDIGHRPSRHHTAVVPVHLLDGVASNVARQGTTLVFSWTPRISTT